MEHCADTKLYSDVGGSQGLSRGCGGRFGGGALLTGVVDGVVAGDEKLAHRGEAVAALQKGFDDAGESGGGVESGVVKEHDAAGLDPGGDSFGDVSGGEILPVEGVPA